MKWSYTCSCEWGYLKEEAELKPGSPAAEWYSELKGGYGEDFNRWPRFGCRQGFRAFANGASCVMELKVGDTWQASVSERLPPQLDDALKGRSYEFFKVACARLTPREIYNALPMCFPMTHVLTVGSKEFRGVARYPLKQWEEWCSCDDTKCWAKFCMKVAQNDLTNLDLFRVAENLAGD